MTDLRELMIAAQDGDSDAYRQFLSQVVNLLAQFYINRLPAPLFGPTIRSALLTIHAVRHTYDPATPLEPWLYEIAMLRCGDALRTPGETSRSSRQNSPRELYPINQQLSSVGGLEATGHNDCPEKEGPTARTAR